MFPDNPRLFEQGIQRLLQACHRDHLLLSMAAPLLIALALPTTLLLRALSQKNAVRLVRVLHSPPLRLLTTPGTALLLSSGGLVVLYFTPLYELSTRSTPVHALVHAHLVLSGLLFAWVILGLEPTTHRPSVRLRLVVLGVAIAVHAVVSQLLHAQLWVGVREPAAEMEAAGALMYFGGDVLVLLLALALLVTARGDHDLRRQPGVPARTHPSW